MLSEKALNAAEAFVNGKIYGEAFQVLDDWYNWSYKRVDYDINIFLDFHTGKMGATLYPLKEDRTTDTLKGVRIL